MRVFLKSIVAVLTVLTGWFLGVYLLDEFVYWKFMLFVLVCWAIGHAVYKVLRMIDRRFISHEK